MHRILFVDDEKNVLDALKRMLYAQRSEWDMTFVTGGAEALRCLDESGAEVIITDVRMPGMNGIELLQEVATRHPQVIRMVLSGTADMELTLQSVSLSHQYLLKPCDAQTLRSTVQRALCLREMLYNPSLRGLISQIQSLPSLPAAYEELVQLLKGNNASATGVGRIMARDMGMTAKVLQLVNSAFFGVSRRIVDPVEAVVYLGMETVRALVFSASAFSQFRVKGKCCLSVDGLQQHCLAVGTLARKIAGAMRLSPQAADLAFTGGLLHDIGKLVLVSNYPERYEEAMMRAREEQISICDAECSIFGTSHPEIGAYLLWLWGLPDPVAEILALHHRPSRDPDVSPAVVAVHVANALVNGELHSGLDLDCIKKLGLESQIPHWQELYDGLPEAVAC